MTNQELMIQRFREAYPEEEQCGPVWPIWKRSWLASRQACLEETGLQVVLEKLDKIQDELEEIERAVTPRAVKSFTITLSKPIS